MGLNLITFFASLGTETIPVNRGFDDSIVFSQNQTIDNTPDYHWNGDYLQNPSSGKFIHIFANGPDHLWNVNKKISARTSDDNGQNFSSVFDIYDPVGFGTQDVGGGYDTSGKLHLFTSALSGTGTGDAKELRYFTSDNDGATISTPTTISTPADGLNTHRVLGTMINNNGIILKPMYKFTDEGDVTESAIYVMRSVIGGDTWTFHEVKGKSTNYYNEGAIISLGGNNLLFIARDEVNKGWQQYRSSDNGENWLSDGNTQLGETFGSSTPKPACLRAFSINRQRVIGFHSFNQNSSTRTFVVYAKALDLINNGLSAWNLNTKYLVEQSASPLGGYGNVIYLNNTLEAKAQAYQDDDQQDSRTWYQTLKTTHYQSLISELGL